MRAHIPSLHGKIKILVHLKVVMGEPTSLRAQILGYSLGTSSWIQAPCPALLVEAGGYVQLGLGQLQVGG